MARNYYEVIDHPLVGKRLFPRQVSAHYSNIEPPERRHTPLLGEHNHEVLGELLGLDAHDLQKLRLCSFKLVWHYEHTGQELFAAVHDQKELFELKPLQVKKREKRPRDDDDGREDDGRPDGARHSEEPDADTGDGGRDDMFGFGDVASGGAGAVATEAMAEEMLEHRVGDDDIDWGLLEALGKYKSSKKLPFQSWVVPGLVCDFATGCLSDTNGSYPGRSDI